MNKKKGNYKRAKGVLPWKEGDEKPEAAIRRLRSIAEEQMKWNKNILITGASGFIAHWLHKSVPRYWAWWGYAHQGYEMPWDSKDWGCIIHLAPVPVDRVLECAKRCNATVLLASSGGVLDKEPSDYMKMKLEDERKLLESGLDVKIARIFTTCGAHMDWERYAIGKFIRAALKDEPMYVNMGIGRTYMYGSDLAEWLWKILLNGPTGSIYNVGSEKLVSLWALSCYLKDITNSQSEIIKKYDSDPHSFYCPNTTLTRRELGLEIKVPFEEAIAKTIEDYKNEIKVC